MRDDAKQPPLASEAYAARLRAVTDELTRLGRSLALVADVRTSETDGYWRLTLLPVARGACPLDLFVRDDQHFDIAIGTETIEDLPAGDLSLLPALVTAITEGHVVRRRLVAAATGALLAVETRVTLPGERVWTQTRETPIGRRLPGVASLYCDDHYLPYAKASSGTD